MNCQRTAARAELDGSDLNVTVLVEEAPETAPIVWFPEYVTIPQEEGDGAANPIGSQITYGSRNCGIIW